MSCFSSPLSKGATLGCRRALSMAAIPALTLKDELAVPNHYIPATRVIRTLYTVALVCFLSLPVFAQQPDLLNRSLEELSNIQVYSASKHMQNTSDAPSSVTVITADDIQRYGYRTLADILESVRGFYITSDRDYSFLGVRGFGRLGDWNSRVLVLIDGHRINDNILGNSMIGSEFLVDVDLIERVEIVRGPSSSLYGADAFFGVINIVTRKPKPEQSAELGFTPGSFGTYEGRATYTGQYRGVGMLLSGTFYNSQGQTLFFPAYDTPGNNYGIARDLDDESYQHILATFTFHGFTLQGLYSARDRGVPTGYYDSVFNDPRTRNLDYHQYFDLSYTRAIGKKWSLTARTSYDQARLQGPVVYPTGPPADTTYVNTYSFRGNWWDSEVSLSRTLLEKHAITLGTEIIDNIRQDQGDSTSNDNVFTVDPGSSLIWAIYGQDEFSITRKLVLNAGVRYDHYSDFGGSTNPRLGVIYHLFAPTTLKLLYGTAFRAPEPFETEPDFGIFYNDNLNLRPETIRSIEGVVEQKLGEHFKLSGSIFRNDIADLITLENNPEDTQGTYENSGKARATGVEVELDGEFPNGMRGQASYSFTSAVDALNGAELANSPRHLGKLNLTAPVWRRTLFAGLDAQYTSAVHTLAGNTLSSFPLFDLTLLAHTMGKRMDLSASVYNLLDRRYFDAARPEDVEDAFQQDGRSFRVKITARFGKR